jgi:hypothetical protein
MMDTTVIRIAKLLWSAVLVSIGLASMTGLVWFLWDL